MRRRLMLFFVAAGLFAAEHPTEIGGIVAHKGFAMVAFDQSITKYRNWGVSAKVFRAEELEGEEVSKPQYLRFGTFELQKTFLKEEAYDIRLGTGVTVTNKGQVGASGSFSAMFRTGRIESGSRIMIANIRGRDASHTAFIAEPLGEACMTFRHGLCIGGEVDAFAWNGQVMFGMGPEAKFLIHKIRTEIGIAVLRNTHQQMETKAFLQWTR